MFLGDWRATGVSHIGSDTGQGGSPWSSKHTGRWHTGEFDNGGFHRQYELTTDGNRWTISGGAIERAEITFSEDNRGQTIRWEWKPVRTWEPLCDRVAERHD